MKCAISSRRVAFPCRTVDLAGGTLPVALLPEAPNLFGNVKKDLRVHLLSAKRPGRGRSSCRRLATAQVGDEEVKREEGGNRDGEGSPDPFVANKLVELMNDHMRNNRIKNYRIAVLFVISLFFC